MQSRKCSSVNWSLPALRLTSRLETYFALYSTFYPSVVPPPHSLSCAATAIAGGSKGSLSTGHGSRQVQFESFTVAGWLMRSCQPKTS